MSKVDRPTTLDTVFAGSLTCLQYRKGYRFNQDSVLLAHFVLPGPGERLLDMGTGSGIIGLILAYRHPSIRITGLEIQRDLAALAWRNSIDNGFVGRFEVTAGDLNDTDLLEANSFDRIICNPPYMDSAQFRIPEDTEVAIARQGIDAGPDKLAVAASRLLVHGGKLDLIYPVDRARLLLSALIASGLSPVKLRPVHNHPGESEILVMIEAEKNGDREIEILPPFYIACKKGGEYSPEMKSCYMP